MAARRAPAKAPAKAVTETATQKAARLQKELDALRTEVKDLWDQYSPDWCGEKNEVIPASPGMGWILVKRSTWR